MQKNNQYNKTTLPTSDYSKVEEIRKITADLLPRFEYLRGAPDIMYWLMGTWYCESSFNLFHGTPVKSSKHVRVEPSKSSIVSSYLNSPVIQNLKNSSPTQIQLENIEEGFYAHGLSGVMGLYHVRGCRENTGEFRRHSEAVDLIAELRLEVDPGVSITQTLFNADTPDTRKKSIASGMIIMNAKFRQALISSRGNTTLAMQKAVMSYVGKAGQRDANGTSPEDRRDKISASASLVSILAAVNIRRTNQSVNFSQNLIDINIKDAKSRGSVTGTNGSAVPSITTAQNDGKSAVPATCSA